MADSDDSDEPRKDKSRRGSHLGDYTDYQSIYGKGPVTNNVDSSSSEDN